MSRCPAGCQWGLDEQILVGGLLGGEPEGCEEVEELASHTTRLAHREEAIIFGVREGRSLGEVVEGEHRGPRKQMLVLVLGILPAPSQRAAGRPEF